MNWKVKVLHCMNFILALGAWAETPDFIAGAIHNVGGGYFDTGYKAKVVTYPQTTSISASIVTTKDTNNGGNAAYFGYFRDNALDRLFFRQSGNNAQVWFDGGNQGFGTVNADTALSMSADYVGLKFLFNGIERVWTTAPTVDGTFGLHIFGYNRQGANKDNTKFKFSSLTIAERASAEAAASVAHEYVPCYHQGRPALYDRIAATIIYGSNDDFELFDYDIAIPAGRTLQVSTLCAVPRSLTLNAGAEYRFDGVTVLAPAATATMPASGKVKVSLSQSNGSVVYTLIENLPEDFSIDAFEIASMPIGTTGVLLKDGTTLKVRLAEVAGEYPEAMATSIQNDGVGYIDCGYKFQVAKTARIELDFHTTDKAAGTAPGPTVSGGNRALWGYQYGDDKLFFRYNGNSRQIWSPKCAVEQTEQSAGNMNFIADYQTSTVSWSGLSGAFTPATRDSSFSYLLFARGRDGSYLEPSVYDLKAYRIYEQDENSVVSLVSDYRPARVNGVNGLYEVKTGAFVAPTGTTAEFALHGIKYRLRCNGELAYVAGEQNIASIEDNAAAWELIADADGSILAYGNGATASFAMPSAAATLKWKYNLSLTDGESKSVVGTESFVNMSVSGAVTLNFDLMARLQLESGLQLDDDAAVVVNYSRIHGPGVYTLIANAGAAIDLGRFSLGSVLPVGLTGTLAKVGNDLVLKVSGSIAAEANLPERMLTYLRNDGDGYIDLGYAYHVSTYPHTARMELDYTTDNYAGYQASGMGAVRALFGYQNKEKLIIRYSNQAGQVWSAAGGTDFNSMENGDLQVVVDYLTGKVTWGKNETTISVPTADEWCTYLLFARHNGSEVKEKSLFDLRAFRIYEQTAAEAVPTKAYDYRPCIKNGRLALWERVKDTYKYLDDGHYTAGAASYPEEIYGTSSVTQEFASAWTVSPRTVQVRQGDLDHRFTFIADGTLVQKCASGIFTIIRYAADGTELGRDELGAQSANAEIAIRLNGAVRAVVVNERLPMVIMFR